jgi:hypothetical protein
LLLAAVQAVLLEVAKMLVAVAEQVDLELQHLLQYQHLQTIQLQLVLEQQRTQVATVQLFLA